MALSRLILVDDDPKSLGSLAFGFERESIAVARAGSAAEALPLLEAGQGDAIVVSLAQEASAEFIRAVRRRSDEVARVPVVVLGPPGERLRALGAGATDFLEKPAYVRDVTTLVRLDCQPKEGAALPTWCGELAELGGFYYVCRALVAAGRTGVLTMSRGLRRGEVRLYEGEVTSAQVGALHGLAAFRQLLLWTEGRFELRADTVVRRQQIPLQPGHLLEDAARFLADYREMAKGLDPAAVYEQDLRRVAECIDRIPREVNPVLKLFDGSRTLADVIEDSPFRVAETVPIAVRLVELGALRLLPAVRPKNGATAALAIEDWIVGGPTPVLGVPVVASGDDGASGGDGRAARAERGTAGGGYGKGTSPLPTDVDWGNVPRPPASGELPSFAAVVPAHEITGEIERRDRPRFVSGEIGWEDITAPARKLPARIYDAPEMTDSAAVAADAVPSGTDLAAAPAAAAVDGPAQTSAAHPAGVAPTGSAAGVAVQSEPAAGVAVQSEPVAAVAVQSEPVAAVAVQSEPAAAVAVQSEPAGVAVQSEPAAAVAVQSEPAFVAPVSGLVEAAEEVPLAAVLEAALQAERSPVPLAAGSSPAAWGILSGETRDRLEATLDAQHRAALVADGPPAEAKGEVMALGTAPAPLPSAPLSSGPASALGLGGVATAASQAAFDDIEEAFFQKEQEFARSVSAPVETFDDLDEDVPPEPVGFWRRLFGRAPTPAPPASRPAASSDPSPASGGRRPGRKAQRRR